MTIAVPPSPTPPPCPPPLPPDAARKLGALAGGGMGWFTIPWIWENGWVSNHKWLVVFHQPMWKIYISQNGFIFPNFRKWTLKNWNHHLDNPVFFCAAKIISWKKKTGFQGCYGWLPNRFPFPRDGEHPFDPVDMRSLDSCFLAKWHDTPETRWFHVVPTMPYHPSHTETNPVWPAVFWFHHPGRVGICQVLVQLPVIENQKRCHEDRKTITLPWSSEALVLILPQELVVHLQITNLIINQL